MPLTDVIRGIAAAASLKPEVPDAAVVTVIRGIVTAASLKRYHFACKSTVPASHPRHRCRLPDARVAVLTSRLSCRKPGNTRIFTPDRESILGNPGLNAIIDIDAANKDAAV